MISHLMHISITEILYAYKYSLIMKKSLIPEKKLILEIFSIVIVFVLLASPLLSHIDNL